MGEEISCSDRACQTPGHLNCSDLGRAQNTGPTESVPLRTTGVPEPEWLRPGKCIQPRAGLRQFPESNLEPKQCIQGKHARHKQGQTQCGQDTVSTRQCYLFAASLPPHSATEQVSLNKKKSVHHCPLCVRVGTRH